MKTKWMLDDEHECPLSSEEHYASPDCVHYAREHGDRTFLDYCGGAVYSWHGIDGQCCEPALHEGECRA